MKKYILCLFLVTSTLLSHAQTNTSTDPIFKFDKEIINYGKIAQNSDGIRVFEFTNTGKSPLIITNIKTSCDCTIPTKPTEPIMPGEKGKITVSYDTSKIGGFYKMITIFSNSKKKINTLKIRGFVVKKS